MTYLLSPTEVQLKEKLGNIGVISSLCEERGADVCMYLSNGISIGVQRKETPMDFISSVNDGRLSKELPLIKECFKVPVLLMEGKLWYDSQGRVTIPGKKDPLRFTRNQVESMKLSIKYVHGVDIIETNDIDDTIHWLMNLRDYFSKSEHRGFLGRNPLISAWGTSSAKERQYHILQGFDGVGVGLAKKIIDHFGKIPLKWDCSENELMSVKLIGKSRAKKLWDQLK